MTVVKRSKAALLRNMVGEDNAPHKLPPQRATRSALRVRLVQLLLLLTAVLLLRTALLPLASPLSFDASLADRMRTAIRVGAEIIAPSTVNVIAPSAVAVATPQDAQPVGIVMHETAANVSAPWRLPSPLAARLPSKHEATSRALADLPWTQPHVMAIHVRRSKHEVPLLELFVYTAGLTLGHNFSIVACVVGSDMFSISKHIADVFMCRINGTHFRRGEQVSLAIMRDEHLEKAIRGPDTLDFDSEVHIDSRLILNAPADTRLNYKAKYSVTDLVMIASDVRMATSSDEVPSADELRRAPRYEICMMTQIKYTVHLAKDWIDYHRRIGVDMVYLFDNDEEEDLAAMFRDRNDVEVVYWPWQKSQVQAFNYMLTAGTTACKWMLLTDCDEYVMVGLGRSNELAAKEPLRRMVRRMAAREEVAWKFYYIIMGHSGNLRIPKVPLPEAYVHSHVNQLSNNGKVVVLSDVNWYFSSIHTVKEGEFFSPVPPEERSWQPVDEEDLPGLVHFKVRSAEEMNDRLLQNSGSTLDSQEKPISRKYVDLENPLPHVTMTDENKSYTHFRKIWRAVTSVGSLRTQMLVRRDVGDEMCARSVDVNARDVQGAVVCFAGQEQDVPKGPKPKEIVTVQ